MTWKCCECSTLSINDIVTDISLLSLIPASDFRNMNAVNMYFYVSGRGQIFSHDNLASVSALRVRDPIEGRCNFNPVKLIFFTAQVAASSL